MKKLSSIFLLSVSLILVSCSKDDDNKTTPEPEKSTINHYTDVNFSLEADGPRFFNTQGTKDGLSKVSLKKSEITATNIASIDVVFDQMSKVMFYFESPKESGLTVSGATETKYRTLLPSSAEMTSALFDAIKTSDDLAKYSSFTPNNDSFGNNVPVFIFFKNALGKTGIIKVKNITVTGDNQGIVADIIVQN